MMKRTVDTWRAGIYQLVERQTCDLKVVGLVPGRGGEKVFFSTVNVCAYSYSVFTTSPALHSGM